MYTSATKVFLNLLQLRDVHFQILISLKFTLHRHYILRVANLALVRFLEVLLKLVKLCSEGFPFIFDFIQLSVDVDYAAEAVLLDEGVSFVGREVDDEFAVVVTTEPATSTARHRRRSCRLS